jgi:hypothetical protein
MRLFALSQHVLKLFRLHGGMSGTRVEGGRRRASAAKRAVALTAAAGFAVVLALVRQGHPATGASPTHSVSQSTGSSSSSSHTWEDGSSLDGGTLAPPSSQSPSATSHTS